MGLLKAAGAAPPPSADGADPEGNRPIALAAWNLYPQWELILSPEISQEISPEISPDVSREISPEISPQRHADSAVAGMTQKVSYMTQKVSYVTQKVSYMTLLWPCPNRTGYASEYASVWSVFGGNGG